MKSVRVDPAHRTAHAEPGVTWREFDHATQTFGLATTGGQISTAGIAGLTLGGGWGYLARKHGLSCDNLLSVDIVTADEGFLTANSVENADLFGACAAAAATSVLQPPSSISCIRLVLCWLA